MIDIIFAITCCLLNCCYFSVINPYYYFYERDLQCRLYSMLWEKYEREKLSHVNVYEYIKDKVTIQAGTITNEDGSYSLFVMPGTYNLVVTADGKDFEFEKITTLAGEVLENSDKTDFQLSNANSIRTFQGEVSITGAVPDEQYATISYRKEVGCPSDCEMIEIKSINVLDGADYETNLPTDSYQRVASTFGYPTLSKTLDLSEEDFTDIIQF